MENARIGPWFGPVTCSSVQKFYARVCLTICAILLIACAIPASAADTNEKNVLILFGYSAPVVPSSYSDLIESELRARVPYKVNFYIEHMDETRVDDEDYESSFADFLQDTYAHRKLDLVMVSTNPALAFILKHRNDLFPAVPIVYFSQDTRKIRGRTWPGITGVTETQDVKAVIELALRLHPDTKNIAIVTGTSDIEVFWLGELHSELVREQGKLREMDIVGLPINQVLEQVKRLPPKTIVFFELSPRESIQPAIGVWDALAQIGETRPTYCISPYKCVGHGAVAGLESSGRDEVTNLATGLAARILSGERPDDIPVVHAAGQQVLADARQLDHWNIPESALPAGTFFYNREPTLWERDRKYFIPAIGLLLAQTILIGGLLWQRMRKRKAEAILRESEERFRVMADTAPSLIWMCDDRGNVTYLNDRWAEFTGADPAPAGTDPWIGYVHPNDLKDVADTISRAVIVRQPFSQEYRLRRSDGTYRWMFSVASPRVNGDTSFAGFIGSAIDTTDQKLAQKALERVSGQLIEAQEKERSRIARDLHDDICQRLVLLSMELEQVNRSSTGSATVARDNLEEIRGRCSEIAGDVQALSHQLHSSKLDYLGLAAAVNGFCKEFSKQHAVTIEFTEMNVPRPLAKDVSLCLFRVAQEALHNAVKYSGRDHFAVNLTGMSDAIQLTVIDAGRGFDVEKAKRDRGLGLVSMQERVHLVNGTLLIESELSRGTKVLAVVPFVADNNSAGEDSPRKAEWVAETDNHFESPFVQTSAVADRKAHGRHLSAAE